MYSFSASQAHFHSKLGVAGVLEDDSLFPLGLSANIGDMDVGTTASHAKTYTEFLLCPLSDEDRFGVPLERFFTADGRRAEGRGWDALDEVQNRISGMYAADRIRFFSSAYHFTGAWAPASTHPAQVDADRSPSHRR